MMARTLQKWSNTQNVRLLWDVETNATIFLLPNYFNKSEYVYQHKTGDAKQNSAILTEKSSDFYDIK